jgi:peptide/nickel transport system substrate-binding protein
MYTGFVAFNQNPGVSPQTGKPYIEPYKVKWFRDTRFRQAMAYAIDRETIIRTVWNGLALPLYGPSSPGEGYFYNDKVKPYPFDLKRSRELLAEMGLTDRDGDGLIEDAEGHKVQFTLMTNAGNSNREQTSEILRKDLANLGMKVDLKFIEFNLLSSKMDETFDWEAMVMAFTGSPDPQLGANVWKSSSRLHMWYPKQKQPSTPWEARIDEIFSLGIKEMDRAKRKVLYDEWQMIVNEQQPLVYTAVPKVLYGFKNKFDNVYPTVLSAYVRQQTTWNIQELFIKEGYPLE